MDSGPLENDFLESSIRKLDENCLILIFNKLSAADLVRVERVCKSWQEIAKQSWSGFKILTLTPEQLGFRPVGTEHTYQDNQQ